MDIFNPIYTEKTECQDCYKCVRGCPVKAIKVENGSATVVQELCVLCGNCVEACPVGAKKIRNDLGRAKQLLKMKERVIVSLAPSFISEFPNTPPSRIIYALKKLGFFGVSETALGAQEVSAHAAELFNRSDKAKTLISSACPAIVDYLKKYQPETGNLITPLLSPVLAHCKLLRANYGEDIGIVFISPCIAKKREADSYKSLLDAAITFSDLRKWLEEEKILLDELTVENDESFIPHPSCEGALYPVDGGMIAGIKENCTTKDAAFMTFSGMKQIEAALKDLKNLPPESNLFLELLACEGGCINGPATKTRGSNALKRYNVIKYSEYPQQEIPRKPQIDIDCNFDIEQTISNKHEDSQIREALRSVGKYSISDELNCSGCGYETCQDFACALLEGKAEKTMCVSFMRKLAQKKANALIKSMPSGMVIVDNNMKIVECNLRFAEIMGSEIETLYEAKPGLEGASLEKIVPFHSFFKNVLDIGEELLDRDIKFKNSILHVSIFNIEKHQFVGAILQDITTPSVRKGEVIKKAKKVIQRNLATVQKIAYLLGENASETEVLLESIVESFTTPEMEEDA